MDAAAAELWAAIRRLEQVAAQVRRLADDTAQGRGVAWQSIAADEFRRRLEQQAQALLRSADGVDNALQAVVRHARRIEGGGSW